MGLYLGFDTSNYTTSVAVYDSANQRVFSRKKLLPVDEGKLGIRQSDAVFHHVKQLPELVCALMEDIRNALGTTEFSAVSYSASPTRQAGSYMPCFLAGEGAAKQLGAAFNAPVYNFSHQQGHIAAAVFGALGIEGLSVLKEALIAFHVSGGTTDLLHVTPSVSDVIDCRIAAKSLDLKAGQLIDRVGGMLGLAFPAGIKLEQLALAQICGAAFDCEQISDETLLKNYKFPKLPKVSLKEGNCSLSGIQNKCEKMLSEGKSAGEIALFTILNVISAMDGMLNLLLDFNADSLYNKELPIVFSGGVTSNSLIRKYFTDKYQNNNLLASENLNHPRQIAFAPPWLSCDNAVGTAILGYLKENAES